MYFFRFRRASNCLGLPKHLFIEFREDKKRRKKMKRKNETLERFWENWDISDGENYQV